MYFESEGSGNTQSAVEFALKTADERGIRNVVIATSTGATARLFWHRTDLNIVAVTHVYGYPTPGENELSPETRSDLVARGIKVLTAAHALSGVERGLSKKFTGVAISLVGETFGVAMPAWRANRALVALAIR